MARLHIDDVDDNDIRELKKLSGTVSEHVRIAIKEYLEKKFSFSTSPTKEVTENE